MGRAPYDATSRGAAALAGLVAALAVLTPSLLGASDPATVGLAVVTLVVAAALVRLGDRGAALAAGLVATGPPAGGSVPRVLSGRATDPTHHPLRPRAPGTA